VDFSRLALTAASITETGVASAGLAGIGLLIAEVAFARRHELLPADSAPQQDGLIGDPAGPPVRLVLLGDSTAAGVGAIRPAETVGRQIATLLARRRYQVHISSAAVAGSRTGDLGPQVSRALLGGPDIAIILVGSADVLRLSRLDWVAADLGDAVVRLRQAGVQTVVGTCPDLGAAPAFAQPLRALVGMRGRQLAAVQALAAHGAGAIAVDLAAATGRVFRADRGAFSEDGFHPSADGYRLWAEALAPAIAPTGAPVSL
jgi:lysophospholipase L1-like esterase